MNKLADESLERERKLAEEAAGDVYWQVCRQALRFDVARGNAIGWLLTITRSRALDGLRRGDEAQPHPEPESLIAGEISSDGDPQDLLQAAVGRVRVRRFEVMAPTLHNIFVQQVGDGQEAA